MKPEDNMQKFIELRAAGSSFKEISELLGVPVAGQLGTCWNLYKW